MEKIADSVLRLIGNTPMVELIRLGREAGAEARIVAKVESFNPAGSVKDRIALAMVEQAEARGTLRPGGTIIEPTSGNTGVGLALVSALKGYRLILTMPETMSIERRRLVAAYGARVILTPGDEGMKGAIARAEALRREIPGAVILEQFSNPANPERHYRTTGDEIWRDTDGRVDLLVAGVGTGGTLCGTGRRLRELNPQIGLVAVEPASSPVLSGGKPGAHKIQGIGAGFIPENFDAALVDRVMTVTDEQAIGTARLLAAREGLLAGISSGAAVCAALQLARERRNRGKMIVVVLALVSALKGYRLILTMPETMSIERRRLVAAYGARVILTPGDEGMKGAIARAEALRREIPGAVILGQFSNPANPERHYRTTGDEIWRDTDGRVDLLVAGVGTGGTLCGTGRRLRELNPQIGLVAVEPASSPVLSGGKPGAHKIQGIGAGFIPENFDAALVDRVMTVNDEQAIGTARLLAAREGLLAGISSGAAVCAALQLARERRNRGKTIVVVLADTGERYLSTPLYAFDTYKTDLPL